MTSPQNIILPDHAQSLAHYPHARRVGDFLYLSGASSRRADNTHRGVHITEDGAVTLDITEQTEGVIANLKRVLNSCGAELSDLVDITAFLVDMEHYAGYNKVYNRYFDPKTGPTRTTVAVHQLPHPHLLIEMRALAFLGPHRQ